MRMVPETALLSGHSDDVANSNCDCVARADPGRIDENPEPVAVGFTNEFDIPVTSCHRRLRRLT